MFKAQVKGMTTECNKRDESKRKEIKSGFQEKILVELFMETTKKNE